MYYTYVKYPLGEPKELPQKAPTKKVLHFFVSSSFSKKEEVKASSNSAHAPPLTHWRRRKKAKHISPSFEARSCGAQTLTLTSS